MVITVGYILKKYFRQSLMFVGTKMSSDFLPYRPASTTVKPKKKKNDLKEGQWPGLNSGSYACLVS